MAYTKIFEKPYADGYKNRPDTTTPITAEIKNKETETLLAIEAYLAALQIPKKLSELTNDEGFIKNTVSNLANYYLKSETYARTETYTQAEVQALIASAVSSVAGKLNMEVVESLPEEGISTTTFYLLPKETAEEKNVYDEYINTDGTTSGWELIGGISTSIDLSNYYSKSETAAFVAEKTTQIADDINKNLDTLKFGEVSGSYNIWNGKYINNEYVSDEDGKFKTYEGNKRTDYIKLPLNTTHIRIASTQTNGFWLAFYDSNKKFVSGLNDTSNKWNNAIAVPTNAEYCAITINNADISKFMVSVGNTDTDYEPYIPSVAMLAEENAQQNTEAMDLKMLGWTVPSECPVQNYVDSDGVFHQRIGRVDLGSIDWEQGGGNNKTSWVPVSWKGDYKIPTYQGLKAKIYCSKYTIDSATNVEKQANDKTIAINVSGWVYIYDSAFVSATASEFKASLKGVYLYYELATEKTISVDGNEAVTKVNGDIEMLMNESLFAADDEEVKELPEVGGKVDLSNYYTKEETAALIDEKLCKITIMTEKEYNEITDKKSIIGLVGIANGAIIKKWIDPSRIIESVYLATNNMVIAESYLENVDVENNTWGNLICNGQISLYEDNEAIYVPGNTSGIYLSFDLNEANHDCTIYLVSKALQSDTQNRRMIEACYSTSSNNCPIVAERSGNMQYSIFNSDTNTSNPVTEYCVIALSLSSSATSDKAKFYYNGELAGAKNQSNFGKYILFGGSHMSNTNCDMAIKYIAVVDGIDDQDTVVANMQSLMTAFGIGGAES